MFATKQPKQIACELRGDLCTGAGAGDELSGAGRLLAPPPSQEDDVEQWTRALITDKQVWACHAAHPSHHPTPGPCPGKKGFGGVKSPAFSHLLAAFALRHDVE